MLVQVDELLKYMHVTRTTDNAREALAMILAGVQEELETHLHRPVEPIQIRELLQTDVRGDLYPTITPVWTIIDMTPVSTPQLAAYPTGNVTLAAMTKQSIITRPMLDWTGNNVSTTGFRPTVQGNVIHHGWPHEWVEVQYVGGYNGWAVNGLKLAIMRVATRDAEPLVDDTIGRKSDDEEKANPSDSRPTGWTDDELKRWDRLRRRVVR